METLGYSQAQERNPSSSHSQSPAGRTKPVHLWGIKGFIAEQALEQEIEWKPTEGRNHVDILDFRTGKKYDYEEDSKGNRYYLEVTA